ncbi:hypothetical protein CASFOL_021316 [Castilleja foliolosa]|uniref:C3H1-type domain-containing protein n=1 Tax=Castilleja foliolosa TaxID=1961234 RepID=A0ABD3D0B8_9LAMI
MTISQKTKSVSWASEVNLCQVRLFKDKNESCENLAPGFGQTKLANPRRVKSSQIPLMKWRCPSRFEVNTNLEVVAGEESKEITAQNQREKRVVEAIYPRPSSIPSNPALSVNEEYSHANDEKTRVVPVTPIEDDNNTPNPTSSAPQISQAALTSVLSKSAPLNSVDRILLLKIFNDPKMVQQFVSNYHAQKMSKETSFRAQNKPSNDTQHNTINSSRPPQTGPVLNLPPVVYPMKDINYYKSLIREHGIERRDGSPNQERNVNVVKSKPLKKMKHCKYFKSPKGCRNGANCAYQHDGSAWNGVDGFPDVRNAKRMKLDGGVNS